MLRVERTALDIDQYILYMNIPLSGPVCSLVFLNLDQKSMYMTKGLSLMQSNEGKRDEIFNLNRKRKL